MSLLKVDHIQIAMPRGGESQAMSFYSDILGLREIEKPAELRARGGCWFEGSSFQLHLGVQEDFVPAKKAHIAFLVSGIKAFREKLVQAGIVVIPDQAVVGVQRFYAVDPFGNRLEFIQNGDGFSQR